MTKKVIKKAVKRSSGPTEPKLVTVLVNGQVTGTVPDTGTVGAVAESVAQKAGMRSFCIKIDGKKAETPDANKSLKGVTTFEVYAKDSRG